jgi:hypothetical protein
MFLCRRVMRRAVDIFVQQNLYVDMFHVVGVMVVVPMIILVHVMMKPALVGVVSNLKIYYVSTSN